MLSVDTGIVPSSLAARLRGGARGLLPLLVAACAACASTEGPQPVLIINGGAGGTAGSSSAGAAGAATGGSGAVGGSGAAAGSGAVGGSGAMGGSGAAGGAGGTTGGSAGMASGGAGGAGAGGTTGGSAGTAGSSAAGGSAGSASGGSGGTGAVNLYFSEYIEGSGSLNKAVEIYNAGATLNLTGCDVNLYSNGKTTISQTESLSGTLLAGDVITICVSDSTNSNCNVAPSLAVNFSGNDVVELVCSGQLMDVIGRLGEEPSGGWGSGAVTTDEATLRRKCSVPIGDRNLLDAFDPAVEWEASGVLDDYSDFGSYSCP